MACLTLINALIFSPEDLDFRIHLRYVTIHIVITISFILDLVRNEFMRVGLIDVLDALEDDNSDELQTQLKVFYEHKEEDFDEFAQRFVGLFNIKLFILVILRFDNIRLELDDVNECFELVKVRRDDGIQDVG